MSSLSNKPRGVCFFPNNRKGRELTLRNDQRGGGNPRVKLKEVGGAGISPPVPDNKLAWVETRRKTLAKVHEVGATVVGR